MGTQGGARCPGGTHHRWTSSCNVSPTPCDTHCRSSRDANSTTSVARPVTSGARALANPAPWAWRNAHVSPMPALITRPGLWSRPSLSGAVITLRGAPRHCWPCCSNVLRAGRDRRAPPSVRSYAEMTWCPRHDTAATVVSRGSPPTPSWPPTRSGAPISRATATRALGAPVIRSRWPMATAAFGSVARRSHQPVCQRPSPCSPACSKRLDCRSGAVRTTVCPILPIPSHVGHRSQRGGCAWASCRSASSPAHPNNTAVMHGGTGRSTPRPLVPRPPPGAPNSAHAIAAAKHAPASAHTKPSIGTRQPHALRSHHVSCPPTCRRGKPLTASRCATSAPLVASGGTIKGSTSHTSASEPMAALRTWTRASGTSPAARSHAAGGSTDTCASKRPMVDSYDAGDCDPCLRTFL
jgi:hypothetical protein